MKSKKKKVIRLESGNVQLKKKRMKCYKTNQRKKYLSLVTMNTFGFKKLWNALTVKKEVFGCGAGLEMQGWRCAQRGRS